MRDTGLPAVELEVCACVCVHAGGQGVCLVLGSEGQGLSGNAWALCAPVGIPMAGNMESLNVSHAGAILMFVLGSLPLAEGLRMLRLPASQRLQQ